MTSSDPNKSSSPSRRSVGRSERSNPSLRTSAHRAVVAYRIGDRTHVRLVDETGGRIVLIDRLSGHRLQAENGSPIRQRHLDRLLLTGTMRRSIDFSYVPDGRFAGQVETVAVRHLLPDLEGSSPTPRTFASSWRRPFIR